jgi:hypothetical protein
MHELIDINKQLIVKVDYYASVYDIKTVVDSNYLNHCRCPNLLIAFSQESSI